MAGKHAAVVDALIAAGARIDEREAFLKNDPLVRVRSEAEEALDRSIANNRGERGERQGVQVQGGLAGARVQARNGTHGTRSAHEDTRWRARDNTLTCCRFCCELPTFKVLKSTNQRTSPQIAEALTLILACCYAQTRAAKFIRSLLSRFNYTRTHTLSLSLSLTPSPFPSAPPLLLPLPCPSPFFVSLYPIPVVPLCCAMLCCAVQSARTRPYRALLEELQREVHAAQEDEEGAAASTSPTSSASAASTAADGAAAAASGGDSSSQKQQEKEEKRAQGGGSKEEAGAGGGGVGDDDETEGGGAGQAQEQAKKKKKKKNKSEECAATA